MLTNKIEIRHLRTLHALRETGSVHDAADSVCLTTSALSHQIKSLEGRLGCSVISHRSRPIVFTSAGKRLLALADEVLPLLNGAMTDVARLATGATGRLNLAVECHSCFDWLLPALSAYRDEWTDVDLDVSSGFHFHPLPALKGGELDLVITSDPVDDLELVYEPLFCYEAKIGIATSHPLTKIKRRYIEPQDLADETIVTYPIEHGRLDVFKFFLDPAGVEPENTRHCELTTLIVHLVANGRGVACFPNWVLEEFMEKNYITTKSLGKDGVWSTLYAAVRKDRAHLEYVQSFFEVARTTCFETLSEIRPVDESTAR